jgi:exodeoxyribonuclease VII small subunit
MTDRRDEPPSLEAAQALMLEGGFEETLVALESVVEHLERGRMTIEESVLWYETGLALTQRCAELLERAELRIRTLGEGGTIPGNDDDSNADNEP